MTLSPPLFKFLGEKKKRFPPLILPLRRHNGLVAQMVKSPSAMQETRVDPWVGKIPSRRAWQPTPVFLPGKSHGQKNLAGYSPWGHKELDIAEEANTFTCRKRQPWWTDTACRCPAALAPSWKSLCFSPWSLVALSWGFVLNTLTSCFFTVSPILADVRVSLLLLHFSVELCRIWCL